MGKKKKTCELRNCSNMLVPGSAAVGYRIEGKVYEITVCPEHAFYLQVAPRGTWEITKRCELKAIAAKPKYFT